MKNALPKLLVVALLFCGAGTMMLTAKCSKKDGSCRTSCDKNAGDCGKKGKSCRSGAACNR